MNSFRFKLQTSSVALGLLAIVATGWQAWTSSLSALRTATEDRLITIRETKRHMLETYFRDVSIHVLALSSDEATITGLEALRSSRDAVPPSRADGPEMERLRSFYRNEFAPTVSHALPADEVVSRWLPLDPRTITLQDRFISGNPHPMGAKDLLLEPEGLGKYGAAHARFHPTFHRYQTAFGFYDIFLIDASDGRILYSVFKETDFDRRLDAQPYAETALASVYRKAMQLEEPNQTVTEDYGRYIASHLAPAAFVAAPIWRAGAKVGVLVIQVSAEEVNQLISGSANWSGEGLGDTGNVYMVGDDGLFRSDPRFFLEDPDGFLADISKSTNDSHLVDTIRTNRTCILNLALDPDSRGTIFGSASSVDEAVGIRGQNVIRAFTPLDIEGMRWFLVAEMSQQEAFEPLRQLSARITSIGMLVGLVFLVTAWWIAGSVTKPVLRLADGVRRLGERDFGVHLPVTSSDELGDLAMAFNRMTTNLQKTTVSRDELDQANRELRSERKELKTLAKLLIEAQELERNRLARELHDDFTQRLAALAIHAGRVKNALHGEQSDAFRSELEEIQEGLSRLSKDVHGLSRRLHPSILDDLGLVAAVENECRGYFERGGAVVDWEVSGEFQSLPMETQVTIYRIVQEGLRNTFRHAGATEISLSLQRDNNATTLVIQDNGVGFSRDQANWKAGLGLASMVERAKLVGGVLTVESAVGVGTVIKMTIPEV